MQERRKKMFLKLFYTSKAIYQLYTEHLWTFKKSVHTVAHANAFNICIETFCTTSAFNPSQWLVRYRISGVFYIKYHLQVLSLSLEIWGRAFFPSDHRKGILLWWELLCFRLGEILLNHCSVDTRKCLKMSTQRVDTGRGKKFRWGFQQQFWVFIYYLPAMSSRQKICMLGLVWKYVFTADPDP